MTSERAVYILRDILRASWVFGEPELQEAFDLAISTLRKQIPKKPIDDGAFGKCPCCWMKFNSELLNEYNIKYCPNCGQAIDWSDENA